MGKYVLLLIFLFLFSPVLASTKEYATIKLTVLNKQPIITSIAITPAEAYFDSTVTCRTVINDETPDKVTLDYAWYKNSQLLDVKSATLSGLSDNDNIRCEAVPTDMYGEKGEMQFSDTRVIPSPARVRILKPMLQMVGIQASAKELKETTSLSAITGMVTGRNTNSSITLVFYLGLFLMILIAINLFGLMISIKRKKLRFPTQD